jgi:hypothetical protein
MWDGILLDCSVVEMSLVYLYQQTTQVSMSWWTDISDVGHISRSPSIAVVVPVDADSSDVSIRDRAAAVRSSYIIAARTWRVPRSSPSAVQSSSSTPKRKTRFCRPTWTRMRV